MNNYLHKSVLRLFLFSAPRWMQIVICLIILYIQRIFTKQVNISINAALKLVKNNHGNIRIFDKLLRSDNRNYYKKHLPDIFISLYSNWKNSQNKKGEITPVIVGISVTEKCNLKCKECYAENMLGKNSMPENILRKRIEELISLGTRAIIILGGEPLIYNNLINVLGEYPKALFLVFTNSTLIDIEKINKLKQSPNIITMLSLEGPKVITDARRGSGIFNKVLYSHKLLSENKIFHGFSFTVTSENYEIITDDSFLYMFNDKYIFLIQYISYMMTGCNISSQLALTTTEMIKHNKKIMQMRKDKNYIISNLPEDEMRMWGFCPAGGRGVLHIKPDSQIQACIFSRCDLFDSTDLSLKSILNDKRMVMARSSERTKTCECVAIRGGSKRN